MFFRQNKGGLLFLQAKILCLGIECLTVTFAGYDACLWKTLPYRDAAWMVEDRLFDVDGLDHDGSNLSGSLSIRLSSSCNTALLFFFNLN